jgi:hypothetical protein
MGWGYSAYRKTPPIAQKYHSGANSVQDAVSLRIRPSYCKKPKSLRFRLRS